MYNFRKVETIDFRSFLRNDFSSQEVTLYSSTVPLLIGAASGSDTFKRVIDTAIQISDYLAIGVIIFAGVTWMFGHRTKALEILIGVASGTILVNHAADIHAFLKSL